MKNAFKYLLCALSAIQYTIAVPVFAQEDPVIAESGDTFVRKLRRDEPRPKFFDFTYGILKDVKVESRSGEFGNSMTTINANERFSMDVRFPVSLKPGRSIIGAFGYKQENFNFVNTSEKKDYITTLDQRNLDNVGIKLYYKKELKNDRFLYAFWNANLNSDDVTFTDFFDQFRTNIAIVRIRNTNELTQLGYGLGFGYVFGGASIFPIFVYNQTYSEKWNLEMMLPKSLKLRYTFRPEMYLYLISEIDGASYFLSQQTIQGYDKLSFQRSAVSITLKLERELYDWLWFGIEGGYNIPINLFISEPGEKRSNSIVTFYASGSTIFKFSVFMVVPKKTLYKNAKQG